MPGVLTVTRRVDRLGATIALLQPAYLLRVVKGPDRRKQLRVTRTTLQIGRGALEFSLTDPSVSALHCEIVADEQGFRVRDLGATNGVLLGGRRVRDAYLAPTDDLQVGDTVIRFKLLDELAQRELAKATSFGKLVGRSVVMRELYGLLEKAAASDTTVLIEGATGTGKDLAADAIVSHGRRKDGPLVVVDCSTLSYELAEAALFGHETGAFTGATRTVQGAFERAHGGTLLLDHVDELATAVQPKLLGVLERQCVQRLGGTQSLPVDVRVIATAQRELAREVNRGTFRADLYYRLSVVHLRMPSLDEHPEDLPELVAHFLEELGRPAAIPPASLRELYERTYLGNVRELRNAVERAAHGLAPEVRTQPSRAPAVNLDEPFRLQKERLLRAFEQAYLLRLMEDAEGNVSEAARRARLNRMHLHELLEKHGLRSR